MAPYISHAGGTQCDFAEREKRRLLAAMLAEFPGTALRGTGVFTGEGILRKKQPP